MDDSLMVFRSRDGVTNSFLRALLVTTFISTFLFGCSNSSTPMADVKVRVSQLDSKGLVLQLNDYPAESVDRNGLFTFRDAVLKDSRYNISIARQPENENCLINKTEAIAGAESSELNVICNMDYHGEIYNERARGIEATIDLLFYYTDLTITAVEANSTSHDIVSNFEIHGRRYFDSITSIAAFNELLYVTLGAKIYVLDYTDPTMPSIVDIYDFSEDGIHFKIKKLAIHDNYAYLYYTTDILHNEQHWIDVFEIGTNGTLSKTNKVRVNTPFYNIDFSNNIMTLSSCSNIDFFNISNPTTPILASNYTVEEGCASKTLSHQNKFFFSIENTLKVLDISDLNNIELIDKIITPSDIEEIEVSGDHLILNTHGPHNGLILRASLTNPDLEIDSFLPINSLLYVATTDHHLFALGTNGLQIIPESAFHAINNPTIIESNTSFPNVATNGSYIYVSTSSNDVSILDTNSDPEFLVNKISFENEVQSVSSLGSNLYVFEDNVGVKVFDLTDKKEPTLINQIPLDGYPLTMVADTDTLYIVKTTRLDSNPSVSRTSTSFIDISSPSSSEVVESSWAPDHDRIKFARLNEHLLTLQEHEKVLKVWLDDDVRLSKVTNYNFVKRLINDIDVVNNLAYTIGPEGLSIYDIKDFIYHEISHLEYITGDYLVVNNGIAYTNTPWGIIKIDVSDASEPRVIGVLGFVPEIKGLWIAGNKLAATSYYGKEVFLIDTEFKDLPTPDFTKTGNATDLEVFEDQLIVNVEFSGLDFFDISDLTDIKLTNKFTTPMRKFCGEWWHRVNNFYDGISRHNGTITLTGRYSGVMSVDISDIANPTQYNAFKCGDQDIFFSDSKYIAELHYKQYSGDTNRLDIFDSTSPNQPKLVGTLTLEKGPHKVILESKGDIIYLFAYDTLYVLDSSAPAEEFLISQLKLADSLSYSSDAMFSNDGNHIFISTYDSFNTINIQHSNAPSIASRIELPEEYGAIRGYGIHENLLYLNTDTDMIVYDQTDIMEPVYFGVYPSNNLLLHDKIKIADGALFSYDSYTAINVFSLQ